MKKQLAWTFILVAALAAMGVSPNRAKAGVTTDTIGIHFGAEAGLGSILGPAAVAGAPGVESAHWNNSFFESGRIDNLMRDNMGIGSSTQTAVIWFTTNNWASTGMGEENNNFQGDDRTLMTGYLDQNTVPYTTIVAIANLPDDMAASYDVYIYMLGGVPERGGEYTVNGVTKSGTVGGDGFNGPDYVEDPGLDHSTRGNYLVFRGLSAKTVVISSVNTFGETARSGINGVEIVKTSR